MLRGTRLAVRFQTVKLVYYLVDVGSPVKAAAVTESCDSGLFDKSIE